MLTYKIHFIRHGLTQANLEGRYIGSRTDLPLCPQGKAMLEQLCEDFRYPLVERVYTSPLLRARQSAEILFPDCAIKAVENLRELDFGDFEGRTAQELEQAPDFQQWITAPPSTPTPGGESSIQLQTRAIEALAYILGQMMEQQLFSVAIVTHGGLIMHLLAAMGLPQREAVRWNTEPGRGYTALLSAQMWMRDHKFEVYEQIPYPYGNEQPQDFPVSYWEELERTAED